MTFDSIYREVIHQCVSGALLSPLQPSLDDDVEERAESQFICSTNVVHQADQILRRCVSTNMAQAKSKS